MRALVRRPVVHGARLTNATPRHLREGEPGARTLAKKGGRRRSFKFHRSGPGQLGPARWRQRHSSSALGCSLGASAAAVGPTTSAAFGSVIRLGRGRHYGAHQGPPALGPEARPPLPPGARVILEGASSETPRHEETTPAPSLSLPDKPAHFQSLWATARPNPGPSKGALCSFAPLRAVDWELHFRQAMGPVHSLRNAEASWVSSPRIALLGSAGANWPEKLWSACPSLHAISGADMLNMEGPSRGSVAFLQKVLHSYGLHTADKHRNSAARLFCVFDERRRQNVKQ
ncbi:hypothetical protein MTO96_011559 [Rhipicephalus appendiculatus]